MNMMFKAFSKKLFGTKYERLTRTFFIYFIVFWGLHISGFRLQTAPYILYLMLTTFTSGVMWQALSSEAADSDMPNMLMIPFERRRMVFSYVTVLGIYTILTKTAALAAVLMAVSDWNGAEILVSIFCIINAVLMTAAVYSIKRYWPAVIFWSAVLTASALVFWNTPWIMLVLIVNILTALLVLQNADGYSFYQQDHKNNQKYRMHQRSGHYSVWIYLFRYLNAHKNYLTNTFIMWCAACILPLFFEEMEARLVIPIGFAILSLNTPICILLSCDPALEQAVRFLPDQKRIFCIPYSIFIFLCNIIADSIFLCSWQFQIGGVTVTMIIAAVFFALISAACSVFLEWFYPIRGWKIESDLWHHPRKYIVPAAMLLIAGAAGTAAIF